MNKRRYKNECVGFVLVAGKEEASSSAKGHGVVYVLRTNANATRGRALQRAHLKRKKKIGRCERLITSRQWRNLGVSPMFQALAITTLGYFFCSLVEKTNASSTGCRLAF